MNEIKKKIFVDKIYLIPSYDVWILSFDIDGKLNTRKPEYQTSVS